MFAAANTWKLRTVTGQEYVNHDVKNLAGNRSYLLVTRPSIQQYKLPIQHRLWDEMVSL